MAAETPFFSIRMILQLPTDIRQVVYAQLDTKTLLQTSQTCKFFHRDIIASRMLENTYNDELSDSVMERLPSEAWMQFYKPGEVCHCARLKPH
jgi:hypothetical protein